MNAKALLKDEDIAGNERIEWVDFIFDMNSVQSATRHKDSELGVSLINIENRIGRMTSIRYNGTLWKALKVQLSHNDPIMPANEENE